MTSDSINYAEYTVTQKSEGKYLRNKILILLLYAAVTFAYLGIMTVLSNYGVLVAIITLPFIPITIFIIHNVIWSRTVNVEHKTEVTNAKLRFTNVYGHKKEQMIFENLISEFSAIEPVEESNREKWEKADRTLDFRGTVKADDAYFGRLEKNGQSLVVFFEATNKMVKAIKFYNSSATVVKELRI